MLSTLFPVDHSTSGGGGCANDLATITANLSESGLTFGSLGPAASLSDTGFVMGFQDESLSPHAASCGQVVITLPYQLLDGVLKPEYVRTTTTTGPVDATEKDLDPCDVRSIALQVGGNVTAYSVNLSADAAVEAVAKSDDTYRLKVSAGLGIGAKAIFGEGR